MQKVCTAPSVDQIIAGATPKTIYSTAAIDIDSRGCGGSI